MPGRSIVSGILFVMIISLAVMLVEIFLPVSKKIEMNIDCRGTMLKMEISGGLSADEKLKLRDRLENIGLSNITVAGTSEVKQGEELNLRVEADYIYSRFSSIFKRQDTALHMVYDRTSIARKVVN